MQDGSRPHHERAHLGQQIGHVDLVGHRHPDHVHARRSQVECLGLRLLVGAEQAALARVVLAGQAGVAPGPRVGLAVRPANRHRHGCDDLVTVPWHPGGCPVRDRRPYAVQHRRPATRRDDRARCGRIEGGQTHPLAPRGRSTDRIDEVVRRALDLEQGTTAVAGPQCGGDPGCFPCHDQADPRAARRRAQGVQPARLGPPVLTPGGQPHLRVAQADGQGGRVVLSGWVVFGMERQSEVEQDLWRRHPTPPKLFDMRTIVREAYDTPGLPSTVLGPVLALTRRLREGGLPVSTGESIDAVRALAQVDPGRRVQVRAALRASLVKDPAHDDVFALAFEAVFLRPRDRAGRDPDVRPRRSSRVVRGDDTTDALADAITAGDNAEVDRLLDDAVDRWAGEPDGRSVEHHVQRVLRGVDLARLFRRVLQPDPGADTLQRNVGAAEANARMEEIRRRIEALVAASLGDLVGAPPAQPDALEDTPLLRAGPDELAALRSTVRPLARRLATRLGRKARRRGHGTLDMRRTLRRSIASGGVPIDIVLKRRHPTKPDLVVLCDVSGSTAQFAPFTLALLHAVHQEFRRVRSFVFVDGIVEITDLLESSPGVLDPRHLLDRRGLMARDGRSDYALAFEHFLRAWPDAVSPKSTVIICGDARSHDRRPAAPAMAELGRRSRRLYWLDPEPRAEWDLADSDLALYEMYCTDVFEVSTLRQLAECVARIA